MGALAIVSALAQFAPSILRMFKASDDVVEIAKTAGDVAKAVTGKDTVDDAIETLKADPGAVLEYQKAMIKEETDFEQMYVSDKANARSRDIALAATPSGNVRANWLVGVAVAIICALLGILLFKPIEPSEYVKGIITVVIGGFTRELWNVYSFEFGTTRRSRLKNEADMQSKMGGL